MGHRGDVDRAVDHVTRRLARRSRPELLALLRSHGADRVSPRGVGPWGQLAETCLHLRDVVRPLGLQGAGTDAEPEEWHALHDDLTAPDVAPALVPPGRLEGLSLLTPQGRSWGTGRSGRSVRGEPEALTGRRAALPELTGDGAVTLAARLGA